MRVADASPDGRVRALVVTLTEGARRVARLHTWDGTTLATPGEWVEIDRCDTEARDVRVVLGETGPALVVEPLPAGVIAWLRPRAAGTGVDAAAKTSDLLCIAARSHAAAEGRRRTMAYGERAHFDRWAADKHGRAKTPEFYVRTHEPNLSRAEAEQKAAALRAEWGLPKLAEAGGAPKGKRASAPKRPRAAASAPPRPAAPASPAEKALAAYAEALRRKAVADERVRELQAALNAAMVERDACDHDIRETWSALEALNAQITMSGAGSVVTLGGQGDERSGERVNGNGEKRQGRRKSS